MHQSLSVNKPVRRRRMFAAGRIAPKSNPCLYGHVGPYRLRPDMTAWIAALMPGAGEMGDCLACGSTVSAPAGAEVVR